MEQVRRLATEKADAEIADTLNQQGCRSAKGKPFTQSMIAWIRYKHRIPAPELKRPEELTVAQVAEKFDVSPGVVYYWVERGVASGPPPQPRFRIVDHPRSGNGTPIAAMGREIHANPEESQPTIPTLTVRSALCLHRRNPQRPLLPVRLRQVDPPHRLRLIPFRSQFLRQFVQPPRPPRTSRCPRTSGRPRRALRRWHGIAS